MFDTIRARANPEKIDRHWFVAAGFKSSNDRAFRIVLIYLGAIGYFG